MIRSMIFAAPAFGLLAGCAILPSPSPADEIVAPAAAPETVSFESGADSCGLLASRGWEAWVSRMPGPGMKPEIQVTGEVDARSGGYTFAWAEGPRDGSVLRLRLVPKAPDGMATMAITSHTVRYKAPAPDVGYTGVKILCGPVTLAEIREVTTAQ